MFSKLVSRNSKGNRKENGLFFGSMLAAIIVFYIILALPRQDVMIFLSKMESDAVNKLMSMIPVFYGMALVILFFLIYYASRFQMERRKHEQIIYHAVGRGSSEQLDFTGHWAACFTLAVRADQPDHGTPGRNQHRGASGFLFT